MTDTAKIVRTVTGKVVSNKTKQLIRDANIGKKVTLETKQKMSTSQKKINRFGNNNVSTRQEVKDKLRIIRSKQLLDSNSSANYNPKACKFFNILNRQLNVNGEHALFKGERVVLGYWLDFYEPSLNLVIEWDEPHHYTIDGKLRERDVIRQTKIQNKLKCNFIRIKQTDVNIRQLIYKLKELYGR